MVTFQRKRLDQAYEPETESYFLFTGLRTRFLITFGLSSTTVAGITSGINASAF